MLHPALFLALIAPFAQARQIGSGDPIYLKSPLVCDLEMHFEHEKQTVNKGKKAILDVTLEYACGVHAPEKMSAKAKSQARAKCRGPLREHFEKMLSGLSRQELEEKLQKILGDSMKIKAPEIEKLASQTVAQIVDALLDPNKRVEIEEKRKEETSYNMALRQVRFAPIVERFDLTPVNSEEGRKLEQRWFRKIQFEGVEYFEPSYGNGDFHLGNLKHLQAAKNALPDTTELLANSHAVVGPSQGNAYLDTGDRKMDYRMRLLALRRANGETVGLIQLMRAPKRQESESVKDASGRIELVRQWIVPGNGEALEVNLLDLPEIKWPSSGNIRDKGIIQHQKISGKYSMKASCVPQALPPLP